MAQSPSNNVEFRRIFDAYFDEVQRYCGRRLSPEDANDALAEVFLVAWRRLEAVPPDEEALPWLIGVARNAVRNVSRSRRRSTRLTIRARSVGGSVVPSPEMQVVKAAEYGEVAHALESLRPDDREIIRLRAWEELTAPQIASAFGISVSAAEKRIARAIKRLESAVMQRRTSVRPREIEKGGDA